MNLDRPLAIIDVEGTGLDTSADAIWEYGCVVLMPDGTHKGGAKRFKPWKEIPAEVQEKCHVTNEELAACPPISEFMEKILKSLRGKHIAGYNLRSYDLPILDAEARRCGMKLELDGLILDVFSIFRKKHERKLLDAVRIYCGEEAAKEFEAHAHEAGHDANWTMRALQGQLTAHEDLAAMSLPDLAAFCQGDREYVDWAGKLYRDKDGYLCFGFGTHRDQRCQDRVAYCNWMLSPKASFPGSTLDALSTELEKLGL